MADETAAAKKSSCNGKKGRKDVMQTDEQGGYDEKHARPPCGIPQ